jgi:hypothetical protein
MRARARAAADRHGGGLGRRTLSPRRSGLAARRVHARAAAWRRKTRARETGLTRVAGVQSLRVDARRVEGQAFRLASCIVTLLSSVFWGCSAFDDLKLAPQPDAGTCTSAGVPPRPSTAPDSGGTSSTGEQDFTVVFRSVEFGDSTDQEGKPRWPTIGFDLDVHCTGQGEGPSCTAPIWATADPSDGLAGRDNAFGAAVHEGSRLAQFSTSSVVSEEMVQGRRSLAIRVSNYNGLSNDDHVKVEVIGIRFSGVTAPQWNGTDVWRRTIDFVDVPDGTAPGDSYRATYFDDDAYVSDHWLVASFVELRGAIRLLLRRVVVTGRIVEHDGSGGWSLADGVFGGRADVDGLLAMAEYFPGSVLCKGTREYEEIFKPFACKYADIRYLMPDDPWAPDDPSLRCDGVSLGFNFTVTPALVGNDVDISPLPNNCAAQHDAGLFTAGDTCDSLTNR